MAVTVALYGGAVAAVGAVTAYGMYRRRSSPTADSGTNVSGGEAILAEVEDSQSADTAESLSTESDEGTDNEVTEVEFTFEAEVETDETLADEQNEYYSGNPTADEVVSSQGADTADRVSDGNSKYEYAPNSEKIGYEDYRDTMEVTFPNMELSDVAEVGPYTAENLRENGFDSVSDLYYASDEALCDVSGIGPYTVEQIRNDVGGIDAEAADE